MSNDYISVTLPLTQQGLNVIVVAVFIAIVTGVIWLALSVSDNERPDPARRALEAFGWVYALIWFFLFGGVVISIWWVFNGLPSPFSLAQGDGGAGLLGLGTLIAALLGAPFVLWATLLKHQTLALQRDAHMVDRFDVQSVVEHLGAVKTVLVDGVAQSVPNIEVRIGAILSLERIAQDSTRHDKGRDHVRVMEILCAYIRENTATPSLAREADEDGPFTPRTDIQIAIDVIKRRGQEQIEIEAGQKYRLDLRGCDFRGVDLSRGSFRGAILARCRFEFALMQMSDFSGARFDYSVLNYLDCRKAKFVGADMRHCRIDKPEPTAGGFVWTITMGDTTGLSLISANITCVQYLSKKHHFTFGTKDTALYWELDEERNECMKIKKELSRTDKVAEADKVAKLQEQLSDNSFTDWSSYDGSDMATATLLRDFRETLHLTGWPYND
ncbi:MAG: pentapeptide repeat-containing protein [Rhodobacteraceae bacterium]|nr:pentapeptide repeat-containing protein [Paracoccaceae bacterium]